ncbi:hypothetical protein SAMN02910298_00232 [Pseudobutyrivibrio sp. YE44]|uniref:hypothetical protein n=1 Tax=Pseudobutyrivibrio sp. YE44 TaxID=1520802 RepID=UPI00088AB5D2|nr:hypothetical protein [Pseudobutyrivibrio sp. YE44]SDB07248.1 hypothetical protein SAMN02910298_00232 [Pseudobutyrivibrio sp. YE44]
MELFVEDNRVYCPCCGKLVIKKLAGMAENNCPRCHVNITCIVKGPNYTIITSFEET